MAQETYPKVAALALSLIVLIAALLPLPVATWGLTVTGGISSRLCYPLLHATLLHALLNVWCLLSVVFVYRVRLSTLCWAYVAAVCIPTVCLSASPTVGLSCAIFFLFGAVTWRTERRLYFTSWIIFYVVAGCLLPGTNGLAHVWGYATGLIYGLLNTPIQWIKRSHNS
jgi:membrane associated rhomboid family serine protease